MREGFNLRRFNEYIDDKLKAFEQRLSFLYRHMFSQAKSDVDAVVKNATDKAMDSAAAAKDAETNVLNKVREFSNDVYKAEQAFARSAAAVEMAENAEAKATESLNILQNGSAYSKAESDERFAPIGLTTNYYTASTDAQIDAILKTALESMELRTQKIITLYLDSSSNELQGGTWFVTINKVSNEYATIAAESYMGGDVPRKCVKSVYGGTYYPWSFENPAMVLDVEYRTTERYLGSVVYTRAIDAGYLPNSAMKQVSFTDDTSVTPFAWYGSASNGTNKISIPYQDNVKVGCLDNKLVINTTADYSAYSAKIAVKYIKG